MSASMFPVAYRAGVDGHARRRHGGTLVEHAGEARRLSCGEGDRCHVQPCKRVPGMPLLGVAHPERCQRISRWLTRVACRDPDCAQGVVQCHVQFRCVWASAPDRCTVLGGGEDQSLGEMRRIFVASPKVVQARHRVRVTGNVVFADIFSSFVGRSESGRVSLQYTSVSP